MTIASWVKEYINDVQYLYHELIVEKSPERRQKEKKIDSYQFLFNLDTENPSKILIKGDPSFEKTTLVKKIASDWTTKYFGHVSIVFFVYLQLVEPHEILEEVIIKQSPELIELGIEPDKLESFIEHYGKRCLLVCDGFGDQAMDSNEDVLKVIKRQKYPTCNILVASKQKNIAEIKGYFDTIGFTEPKSQTFPLDILRDDKSVELISVFDPTYDKQKMKLHECPLFLLYMCIFIRDDIEFLYEKRPSGEIYTKMVQCLYEKFNNRSEITHNVSTFTEFVRRVGKLAWQSLLSGDPLFKKSTAETEVGEDILEYGFFIGYEGDSKGDIMLTFIHSSIRNFLRPSSLCFT